MSFQWTEFLRLAQELSERADDEASLRSSISRAYYAAFCKAHNYLIGKGITIPRNDSHTFVWDSFYKLPGDMANKIADDGHRTHQRRIKADYHDNVSGLKSEAVVALSKAKLLLERINNLN